MPAKANVDDLADCLTGLSVEAPKSVVKVEKDDDGYNSSNSDEVENVKRDGYEESDKGVDDIKNDKKEDDEVELQPLRFAVETVEPEHIILISRGPIDHDSLHNR